MSAGHMWKLDFLNDFSLRSYRGLWGKTSVVRNTPVDCILSSLVCFENVCLVVVASGSQGPGRGSGAPAKELPNLRYRGA